MLPQQSHQQCLFPFTSVPRLPHIPQPAPLTGMVQVYFILVDPIKYKDIANKIIRKYIDGSQSLMIDCCVLDLS